jgi:outer membrane biosynthesis protein TonB
VIKTGGMEFDQATIDAVSRSLFSPALSKDGSIVPVKVRIPYRFELE